MAKTSACCLLTLVLLAACGSEDADPRSRAPSESPSASTSEEDLIYRGYGLVLQEKGSRPELCLGGAEDSHPPQCSGTPLVGWDWDAVPDEETSAGWTWGAYRVDGRYDGKRLEVLDAAVPPEFEPEEEDDIGSACDRPEGGWAAPDPGREENEDRLRAIHAAEAEPDFPGAWIDVFGGGVLNLAFTGNLEEHEAEARLHWGGPLCVVEFEHTQDRLSAIQRELSDEGAERFGLEVLYTDLDITRNRVLIGVTIAEPSTRAAIEREYGEGTVDLQARLRPVDEW